ncbi:transient receptor potential cation channel subfamily A member 1 [Paramuricea clavata]|uniref:Transient receptor potential cation channel subfamily A member 1 n=1 Tax=Paramuricea clavata TaxID=317549 RepID=A0A7D9L1V2_PARCT|nr:transient receptor potential cation channel subfamily A member 1 [Paramuricea clavata]
MSKLIEDIPSVAMNIFDQCVYEETSLENRSYAEMVEKTNDTYNFFPFKPKDPTKSAGKLEAMENMVKYKRDECLGHPLVRMFINKKLGSPRVAKLFILNTTFYTAFLMSLTIYVGLQTGGSYSLYSPGLSGLSVIVLIFCTINVIKEIIQVLPMVTLFIIAFAMAFLMLSQDEGFTTIPISFLTTFVMMTGEMDFRDTFLGNGTSAFTILQKLFLMLFLLLITIAIMNLFTGLAVGDTAEIMKRANQERRLYKANLVLTLEQTAYRFPSLFPSFDKETWTDTGSKIEGWSLLLSILKETYAMSETCDETDEVDLEKVDQQLKKVNAMIENQNKDRERQFTTQEQQIITEVNKARVKCFSEFSRVAERVEQQIENLLNIWETKEESIQEQLQQWEMKEDFKFQYLSDRVSEAREKKMQKQLKKIQNMLELVESNVVSVVSEMKYSKK